MENNYLVSVEDFFNDLLSNFAEAELHTTDTHVLNSRYEKLLRYSNVISALLDFVETDELKNLLESLCRLLLKQCDRISEQIQEITEDTSNQNHYMCSLQGGFHGRPMYDISEDQIIFLRRTGLNWKNISNALNVSTKTLFRHRQRLQLEDSHLLMSDEALDNIIRQLLRNTPNAGEVYIAGGLRSLNVYIPRKRLRAFKYIRFNGKSFKTKQSYSKKSL